MSNKQIKYGAILSYLAIAVNIGVGLIYTPWMVDHIGQSQYGLYTLANSLINLFLIDFGLSAATARYVSKYKAEGNTNKVNSFLGAVYKLYFIVDAVIYLVLLTVFIFIDKIYVNLTPVELTQFKIVYGIASIYSLINFPFVTLNGIMTAYEKFIPLKLADLIYRILSVGFTVVALSFGMGLYALVSINAVSGLIVIIFKYIIIKRTTPVKVSFEKTESSLYKSILGFSLWATVSAIASRLIFNITPTILGIVANSAAIAVFGIVTTIEGYTYTITSAINGMFMPKISRIYANTDTDTDIMPLMLKVGRFQYALNGLIVAVFAVVGKEFIILWMGNDYIDAYWGILLVIIPGLFFNSLQIANTAMIVKKKVNIQALISVIIGVLNVILSFVMSWLYGMIGACVSIFIAYTVRAVLYNIVYHKVMGFDIPQFIKKCYLRMSPPVIIAILLGLGINRFFPGSGIIAFLIKAAFVASIYLISVFFIGIDKSERKTVFDFILRKKQSK